MWTLSCGVALSKRLFSFYYNFAAELSGYRIIEFEFMAKFCPKMTIYHIKLPGWFAVKRLDEKKSSFCKPSSPNQKLPKTTFRIYAWSIGLLDRDLGSVNSKQSKVRTMLAFDHMVQAI